MQHDMYVPIKLEDPQCCWGCPLHEKTHLQCRGGFVRKFAKLTEQQVEVGSMFGPVMETRLGIMFMRPQACVLTSGITPKGTLVEETTESRLRRKTKDKMARRGSPRNDLDPEHDE